MKMGMSCFKGRGKNAPFVLSPYSALRKNVIRVRRQHALITGNKSLEHLRDYCRSNANSMSFKKVVFVGRLLN